MIVVIDTNILVSGVLNPYGTPAAILRLVATGKIIPAHDLRILREYREVLHHPRFGFNPDLAGDLLDLFEKDGISITPAPINVPLPDPDDLPFLEVAIASAATALVTGNKKRFPPKSLHGCRVVSPLELVEMVK